MNKTFEAILSILGDGWEKWSVPHSQQDLWKSFQPARGTYNLQPDLRESFSADVCTDINGQFGCGHRAIFRSSVGKGGGGIAIGQWLWLTGATYPVSGGGGGGFCQLSSYSRRQIPSETLNCLFPKNSFLPRTFHYFHISQPAKNCQKNRYFE